MEGSVALVGLLVTSVIGFAYPSDRSELWVNTLSRCGLLLVREGLNWTLFFEISLMGVSLVYKGWVV